MAGFVCLACRGILADGAHSREPSHLAARQGRDRRPAMGAVHARLRGWRREGVTESRDVARAPRPRDAATLIIVEGSGRAARVLMGKRHEGHAFMPGKFVFPGGRIEAEDRRMSVAGALNRNVEEKLNARVRHPSPGFARAIALAAIRETFEETGLAVGVGNCGKPENPPPGAWPRFVSPGVYPALHPIPFPPPPTPPPPRPTPLDP